jgi:hypothetical protein
MSILSLRSHRRLSWVSFAIAFTGLAGCATGGSHGPTFEQLVVANSSPDAIRVLLDLGDRELSIGRVNPMSQATLRIRSGAVPPEASGLRLRIVPVGTPVTYAAPGRSGGIGIVSEPYRADDLFGSAWNYSGSRILRVGRYRL